MYIKWQMWCVSAVPQLLYSKILFSESDARSNKSRGTSMKPLRHTYSLSCQNVHFDIGLLSFASLCIVVEKPTQIFSDCTIFLWLLRFVPVLPIVCLCWFASSCHNLQSAWLDCIFLALFKGFSYHIYLNSQLVWLMVALIKPGLA